ncbi:MAG: peptidylprolyl isomerase [Candidatus Fimenecus sp.]
MRKRIKVFCCILAVILLSVSFASCGSDKTGSENQETVTEKKAEKDKLTITDNEIRYHYYRIYVNFSSTAAQYDSYYGEGLGKAYTGYDYKISPEDQQYEDEFSSTTGVTSEEIGIENPTWADVFAYLAIESCFANNIAAQKAKEMKLSLTEDAKEDIETTMNQISEEAEKQNLSENDYLKSIYGSNITANEYKTFLEKWELASLWYDAIKDGITNEEIEEEYNAHSSQYGEKMIEESAVRHILVKFPDGSQNLTDGQKAEYKARAQAILDEYRQNPTEANFAALAVEKSEDYGSAADGGLIDGIAKDSSYVTNFLHWSTDASRKPGDTDIIETEYGYHIMYFSSRGYEYNDNIINAAVEEKYKTLVIDEAVNATKEAISNRRFEKVIKEMNMIIAEQLAKTY